MGKFMEGLKAWLKTANMPQRRLSADELQTLRKAVSFENKLRSCTAFVWRLLIDLCAVAAAVFSALSYFKK